MTREIKVTLSDIEGTTTPISFVHDTLFPYAREHIQSYLERHYPSDSDVVACARLIESEAALIGQVTDSIEEQRKHIIACVEKLMQLDRKTPGLKRLQGRVWTEGYQSGEIKGRVFDDVASFLQSPERPTIFAIYSSGSVLAQKLLFGHSEHGDLLPNIHAHFDTQIGGKLEPSSYTKIAHALNVAPEHVVFISDHPGELLAAHDAGMLPMLVKRPGNHVIDANMQMKLDSAQIKEMSTFKDLSRFM